MQVKLLRALQEARVDPVGSKRPVKVDVRIISATNRDLAALAQEGQFREDLYYRLNVFPIFVPSLRDRREDIPALARHFIARFAAEENKPVAGLTPEASDLLERFNWPGNVPPAREHDLPRGRAVRRHPARRLRFPADRRRDGRGSESATLDRDFARRRARPRIMRSRCRRTARPMR